MATTQHILPIECDGLPEKPQLPPGYDATKTSEFQAVMVEDSTELQGLFDQIIDLAQANPGPR